MRTPFLLAATTALLVLTAIPAQAKEVGIQNPDVSTPTTLYFHVINVQDMPINTQVPNDEFTDTGTWGATQMTLRCLHPTTGEVTQGNTGQTFHTSRGYSSPSYVEYDFLSGDKTPRTHPERGISYDAVLDKEAPFTIKWYVVTYNGGSSGEEPDQDQVPTPVPGIVAKATIKSGDAISVDDKSYDQGITIAEGKTAPALLLPKHDPAGQQTGPGPQTYPVPGEHPEVRHVGTSPGGSNIYEFNITMTPQVDLIQRATGFNLRIDMFLDNEALCADQEGIDGEYLMTGSVVPYTGPEARPRMELAVMNPIRLEYLHPQFVGDDLVIHTSMNSVWGNYDVDEKSDPANGGITVDIEGPSATPSLDVAAFVQRTHDHYHHQEAVDVTYLWPYKADKAQDGVYTVSVSFENDQHTARATGVAQFEIGKGQRVIGCGGVQEASQKLSDDCITQDPSTNTATAKSPGLPVAAPFAALAAIAVLLRRRLA
jgi:hypothetical protein